LSNEVFQELSQLRLWQGYSFIYGISAKFELEQTLSFSNHHDLSFPYSFIYFNTETNGYQTNGYLPGQAHPFWFENYSAKLKYRFFCADSYQKHFRMAAYLQVAGGNEPHPEAEPNLLGDNSGAAAGLVATYLKHKFAASVMVGYIIPYKFQQTDSTIVINYANALNYSLSLGYLLLPRHYTSLKQMNVNIYLEFMGESYGAAVITKNGENVFSGAVPSLAKGNYLEARPGLQFIFASNTILSFSPAFPLINRSYAKTYPVYYVYLQHDFLL
ncbi:MAG TPA: hypothetical protein VK808_02535, partial [Bacteroidia bacterium]|nr:hypothetical protein [Bacteroidia bacterium]